MTNKVTSFFDRAIGFYTKYFAVWVLLFGVVAYFKPDGFIALRSYNKLFFALTMFGIGAVLKPSDFKRIAQKPSIVFIGSCAQFVIMPVGAFLIAKLFNLAPEIAVGLIVAGSAPGAMASNVMCYIAKADTAYSVSLTTVSTLLCPVLTPVLTKLLAGSILPVSFTAMVIDVAMMILVPLIAGFLLRVVLREKLDRFAKIFPAISVTFIIFICSLVIALNKGNLSTLTSGIFIAVLVLNLYGMTAGYGVGRLFKMSVPRKRTLSIEIGMQNAGLGTALALEHFGEKAAIPTAIFVFICIITASALAELWQRKDVALAPAHPPGCAR